VVSLSLAICGVLYFWLLRSVSFAFYLPQDCELRTIQITGTVQNFVQTPIRNALITISSVDGPGFEAGVVRLRLHTDNRGSFTQDNISIFRCDKLLIDVSAEGYTSKHLEYRADEGLIDSLPSPFIVSLNQSPLSEF
jgi:hypothetical protein